MRALDENTRVFSFYFSSVIFTMQCTIRVSFGGGGDLPNVNSGTYIIAI